MKRPVSHQINDVARGWFNVRLPREWARNEHFSDYGIDFTVELARTEQVSGITFLAQLKGKEEATLKRDGTFAFSLKRKHANYYADKARQPVFLVLVDLEAETAYWLFVQEYLDNLGRLKNWRSKSKVVVHVPKTNVLSHIGQLEAAVMAAYDYMAPRLVRFKEDSLKNLDPRFEVHVRQTSSQQEVLVRALEPVSLKLFVPNNHAIRSKVKKLFEEGAPAAFLPGEIRIEGSLLLDELTKKGVVLQHGHVAEGAIVLSAIGRDGVRLSDPITLPAKITAGTKVATFDAKLNGAPLQVTTSTVFDANAGQVRIAFDITQWHGCDLRLLPHFERIATFFACADAFAELDMRLEVDGNMLVRGVSAHPGELEYFKLLSKYLNLIRKARFLATRFNLDYEKFRRLTPEECDDIEQLYELVTTGETKMGIDGWTYEVKFTNPQWEGYQRMIIDDNSGENDRLKFEGPGKFVCSMLGQKIELDDVVSELTFLVAVPVVTDDSGVVTAELRAGASSEHIVRIPSPNPAE